jgi:hypothetical protein
MKKLCASFLVAIGCMIGGCSNLGVGVSVSDCCQPEEHDYRSYDIAIKNTPEFLKPYILDGMSQALLDKGLIRDDKNHDLLATLTYQQIDLKDELQKDAFEGHLSPGGDFRFNAVVLIEIRDMNLSKLIWSGAINRDHDVFVGEYMHEARGRRAIYNAITELLADFPGVRVRSQNDI